MQKIRVMVAEEAQERLETIKDYFKNVPDISIIGTYTDGNSLLNALRVTQTDVLLLDLVMPFYDGMKVIDEIKTKKEKYCQPTKIIVMTQFTSNYITNKLNQYSVDYILMNIDYLIDGRYIQEERDTTLKMRGSKNQRILKLTNGKIFDIIK